MKFKKIGILAVTSIVSFGGMAQAEVEPNNNMSQANQLINGVTNTGQILYKSDIDYYAYYSDGAEIVLINFTKDKSNYCDLTVVDSGGVVLTLAEYKYGEASPFNVNFAQSGNYLIFIESSSRNSSNVCEDQYQLTITGTTNTPQTTPTSDRYNEGYTDGKQYCINNPTLCGITTVSETSQSSIDTAKAEGYEDGRQYCADYPEACGISTSTGGFTQNNLDVATIKGYADGKQYCIDNPEACSISISTGDYTQEDIDASYQQGVDYCQQDPAACGISSYDSSVITSDLLLSTNGKFFNIGDKFSLDLSLNVDQNNRFKRVDVYVAVRRPLGGFLYFTEDPFQPYTSLPTPFKTDLEVFQEDFSVFDFEVIPGLGGSYTAFAAMIKSGASFDVFNMLSNIAITEFTFE